MDKRALRHRPRLALATLLAAVACTVPDDPQGSTPPPGDYVRSGLERDSAEPPAADRNELAVGLSGFALDLYKDLSRNSDDNLLFSPLSISTALAMTYAGARANTATEMGDTLRFTLPEERLHPALNWLDQTLGSRGQGAAGADGQGFRLRIANALFAERDHVFLDSFLDLLAVNYGAGMALLDFRHHSEQARADINAWVSEQTEARIPELIPTGGVDSSTRLVLVNAVYFNAAWKRAFSPAATADRTFNAPTGPVTVPMMGATMGCPYAADEAYQAVSLLYDGGELEMVIVLPAEGAPLATFEQNLTPEMLANILASLATAEVELSMPRFEYRFKAQLKAPLVALGMVDAFTDEADFSGMDGQTLLQIGAVIHEAFIKVDEAGTEAAAATAVVMDGGVSAPPPSVPMVVDRPFIFLIRDIETGAILFIGRVLDPA